MNPRRAGSANNRRPRIGYVLIVHLDRSPTIYSSESRNELSLNDIPEAARNNIQQYLQESEGGEIPASSSLPTDLASSFDTFLPTNDLDPFFYDQELGMGDWTFTPEDLDPSILSF